MRNWILVVGLLVALAVWLTEPQADALPVLHMLDGPNMPAGAPGASSPGMANLVLSSSPGKRILHTADIAPATSGTPTVTDGVLPDLIFGVVAFNPAASIDRTPYHDGVQRWVHSVREHTRASRTEVALFTGRGKGNIASDAGMARWIRGARIKLVEDDYEDSELRVAHGERKRFVWCVMRNRWFAIARYLELRVVLYRYVLMSDTRDALLQAAPFEWQELLPRGGNVGSRSLLEGAVVFSSEGSGKVPTLRQSKKGLPRTLECARGTTPAERRALLDTEPLNAGVTVGGADAFLNFSRAMTRVIRRVTSASCVQVKDCTDQGLYNLLVYVYWWSELPHTRKVVLPMERALSYTLGHKRPCCSVDSEGRVLNDLRRVPPVVHQFAKGVAGRTLPRTHFWKKVHAWK